MSVTFHNGMLSESSSPLSSRETTPPRPSDGQWRLTTDYPTPPASQQDSSDADTSCPDGMTSSGQNSDHDGPPPNKRRRISERKPRTTEYLDLRGPTISKEHQPQLDKLIGVLQKKRKIVVVAGAGISVASGSKSRTQVRDGTRLFIGAVPDFRSSTGLFTTLRAEHNIKGSGKDLFDASVYRDGNSTSTFHNMVRNMSKMTKDAKPSEFHEMLATLARDDRLLRLYTQNVDCLDTSMPPLATKIPLTKARGESWPKTVQLHGGLDKMVCSKCSAISEFDPDLFDGPIPPACEPCTELDRVRTDVAGKRSHGIGKLRPRMVLYNEANPDDEAIGAVTKDDLRRRPDAIIVVGTTLKIPGVRRIVREMCATVRDLRGGVAIWINNDPEPSGREFEDCWDIVVRGTCDEVARHADLGNWQDAPGTPAHELTEAEWKRMAANPDKLEVRISPAFKPVPKSATYRRVSASPEFTPIKDRTASPEPDHDAEYPPTPSKSPKRQKQAGSAFDAMQSSKARGPAAKTGIIKAPAASSKRKVTKGKPASKPRAKTSKACATITTGQPRINQTLKQTKSTIITSSTKNNKASKKQAHNDTGAVAMQPIAWEDHRNNGSPIDSNFGCNMISSAGA